MRSLRICILVLLAVLLPVRGLMAATMACAPALHGTQGPAQTAPHDCAGEPAQDGAAPGVDVDGDAGPESVGMQERCQMCSASCSVPPLRPAAAGLLAPHELSAAPFPSLSAPAPTFLSDGQERPPRST